ncbi:MAG: hypothetical protein K1Y01_02765 [Vicinamibacteria bacterium]|nr:hypothetical protein [Vicinamibacteria bacterium]
MSSVSEVRLPPGRLARLTLLAILVAALIATAIINRRVDRALDAPVSAEQAVEFVPLIAGSPLPFWGGEDVESVVSVQGGLYAAGAFGVARLETPKDAPGKGLDRVDISEALPTRRASALTAWRTGLAVGLELEGLFVYRDGDWSEVRSGFGPLHVRALAETPSGELWIGAREGLFRMGFAERVMSRLHKSPVRAVLVAEGGRVVSGGETGLLVTRGGATTSMRVEGADTPWVEDLVLFDSRVFAVTPTGLFGEGPDGVLRAIAGGGNLGSIAVQGDHLFATADPPDSSVRLFDRALRPQSEQVPSPARRVFVMGESLVADTAKGLVERVKDAWRPLSRRRDQEGFGNTHVGALAAYRDRLFVGFFDGGLAELAPIPPSGPALQSGAKQDPPMMLRALTNVGSSPIWAVNALLDAGGVLHVASLRGAFRFDGSRVTPVDGSGAAFSLARTGGGVAIGYGEGVLLPERKLLSAFHGLPGNQATALAPNEGGLLVGTPSGLGYVEGLKVRWRVASGEGKLPHPWVTAILPVEGSVLIGTYGGGVVRRAGRMLDKGEWNPFPETEGLKVNTGCLVEAFGRVYAGTDGTGLFRLSKDGTRFERLKLSLPSQRVTALFEMGGFLYIGTDEGLTRWSVERDVQP